MFNKSFGKFGMIGVQNLFRGEATTGPKGVLSAFEDTPLHTIRTRFISVYPR